MSSYTIPFPFMVNRFVVAWAEHERERAEHAEALAQQERERAQHAEALAQQERKRVEALLAYMEALGMKPPEA